MTADKFVSREKDFVLRAPRNDERAARGQEGPENGVSDLKLPDTLPLESS